MKICVLGLDGATPEKMFQDERIVNIRRLMDMGVYGRLKPVAQTGAVPIWMCMGASQDSESPNLNAQTIWSVLSDSQNRTALLGLTSDFPPYEVNGVSFASFPSSGTASAPVPQTVIAPKAHSLAEQIRSSSHTRWQTARSLYSGQTWAYFQVVDMGLQTFGVDPVEGDAISDYYLWLDEQVGSMLELLDDDTLLLVLSPRGLECSTSAAQPVQPVEGMFVLIAPNCPLNGEYQGASLLDMAPTMLDLIGHEIPSTMRGTSLVAKMQKKDSEPDATADQEALLRDRLAGLGYI
jgi:predicted AlkP superfamily phosphohydrolase/phosphomutase